MCRTAPKQQHLRVTRSSWRTWLTRLAQRSSSVLFLIGQGSTGDKAGAAIQEETNKQRGKKKKRLIWDSSVHFNLSARMKQGLLVTIIITALLFQATCKTMAGFLPSTPRFCREIKKYVMVSAEQATIQNTIAIQNYRTLLHNLCL